ncbi:MAG TPA: hypothetical protein VIE37_13670 [Methylomirabilota bacterium]|jgi:hypothetical protein
MPFADPDPTDPTVLVGVALPTGADATRDMAWVFAEEFARMGFDVPHILRLFRSPFYAGAHQALRRLGEPEIVAMIEECVQVFGHHGRGD